MPLQPTLPLDLAPQHTDTGALFFALLPDEVVARRAHQVVRSIVQPLNLAHSIRPQKLLHISLSGIGYLEHLPPSTVTKACIAGAIAAQTISPFEFTLDRCRLFSNSKTRRSDNDILALQCSQPNADMEGLFEQLWKQLHLVGIRTGKHFAPHITVLYSKHIQTERELAIPSIHWPIKNLYLVQSLIGQSEYVIRGRWTLGCKF